VGHPGFGSVSEVLRSDGDQNRSLGVMWRSLSHGTSHRGLKIKARGLSGSRGISEMPAVTLVQCLSPCAFGVSRRLRPDRSHHPDGPDTMWGTDAWVMSPGVPGSRQGLWWVWGALASPPAFPGSPRSLSSATSTGRRSAPT